VSAQALQREAESKAALRRQAAGLERLSSPTPGSGAGRCRSATQRATLESVVPGMPWGRFCACSQVARLESLIRRAWRGRRCRAGARFTRSCSGWRRR